VGCIFNCVGLIITREIPSIQAVSAKTFEPNISVICQRIFMKFKIQIFLTVKVQLVIIKLPQVKKCNFNTFPLLKIKRDKIEDDASQFHH
jgi:hypothetical protein